MSDKIDDLVARITRLEDLEAIRHTWRDYCIRLDSADWIALGDVFTEDAVLERDGLEHLVEGRDGQYRGRHSIINDFYRRTGAVLPHGATPRFVTGHISTNMQIELEGDEATTLAYFFEIVANDRVLIGTYQHSMPSRSKSLAVSLPAYFDSVSGPAGSHGRRRPIAERHPLTSGLACRFFALY